MLSVKVLGAQGTIAAVHGETECSLFVSRCYEEGDRIVFETDASTESGQFLVLSPDDAMGESLVYVTGNVEYRIPFGEKRVNCSPKLFSGERHLITARVAKPWEVSAYRNLSLNRMDRHGDTNCYPHALANVETRGESVFAAQNAIDGIHANSSHGEWPFGSWGINRNPDAVLKIDFGRPVTIDRLIIYLRADFPHDSWRKEMHFSFSDGTSETFFPEKTGEGQEFLLKAEKTVTWVQAERLIRAEDPSPFPALTQLEVYGREA